MTVPEPLPSRLIGQLFVERGLISDTQLLVALDMQQETGKQLGQILVERFGVPRQEVASVVAEQWAQLGRLGGNDDGATRRRLGDIFLERGFVSEEELELALQRQRDTGERLGEALVAQGVISKFELAGALAEQTYVGDAEAAEGDTEGTVVQLPTPDAPNDEPGFLFDPLAAPDPVTYEAEAEPETPDSITYEAEAEPEAPDLIAYELEVEAEPEVPAPIASPPLTYELVDVVPTVESDPAECVAFTATPTGYRLVPIARQLAPGDVVDVPDIGRLVVMRVGRSPLPLDDRECVYLELPLGVPTTV